MSDQVLVISRCYKLSPHSIMACARWAILMLKSLRHHEIYSGLTVGQKCKKTPFSHNYELSWLLNVCLEGGTKKTLLCQNHIWISCNVRLGTLCRKKMLSFQNGSILLLRRLPFETAQCIASPCWNQTFHIRLADLEMIATLPLNFSQKPILHPWSSVYSAHFANRLHFGYPIQQTFLIPAFTSALERLEIVEIKNWCSLTCFNAYWTYVISTLSIKSIVFKMGLMSLAGTEAWLHGYWVVRKKRSLDQFTMWK